MYEVTIIKHVTWVGFWVNAFLMVLKLAFGYYGHSDALVADGFHSLSDFGTDFIVLMMVGIAYKRADSSHPYGHGKFETLASLIIAVILFAVALGIGWNGIASGISFFNGIELPRPDVWTIIVAVISIVLWMKSSSHVFADRLVMLFPWLWRQVLTLLFHTLL